MPSLTSWAVLGLAAAGQQAPGSLAYLQAQEATLATPADVALVALAEESLGARPAALLDRLRRAESPNGRIGPTVNSTCWAVLALGRSSKQTTRWLLARQAKSGGLLLGGRWPAGLERHGCGARGAAGRRRARCAGDAGGHLSPRLRESGRRVRVDPRPRLGRAVDCLGDPGARRRRVGGRRARAFTYLARLRRPDGSYRYSAKYVTTPVWVTSQVLAALARKPFPLD